MFNGYREKELEKPYWDITKGAKAKVTAHFHNRSQF